jgi:hypothetical protein
MVARTQTSESSTFEQSSNVAYQATRPSVATSHSPGKIRRVDCERRGRVLGSVFF